MIINILLTYIHTNLIMGIYPENADLKIIYYLIGNVELNHSWQYMLYIKFLNGYIQIY